MFSTHFYILFSIFSKCSHRFFISNMQVSDDQDLLLHMPKSFAFDFNSWEDIHNRKRSFSLKNQCFFISERSLIDSPRIRLYIASATNGATEITSNPRIGLQYLVSLVIKRSKCLATNLAPFVNNG